MRDHDPILEQRFYDIFRDYYNPELTAAMKYRGGHNALDRMRDLAALAGNPERSLRVLHIAGTKGKGSTSYLLTALLLSADHRCGTFTSPHLSTIRERFQIDNRLVSYATLLQHAEELEQTVKAAGMQPTLFELMTVLSLRIFQAHACEFAVLETGIGGLLDSTNYIPAPECCVITPVSFDHQQLLGSSIREIAVQKAGIIKQGIPVVCAKQPYEAARCVIRDTALALEAAVIEPAQEANPREWLPARTPPFQEDNFRTAYSACRAIGVVPNHGPFEMPQLRARCERVCDSPLVLLDAAHNADSAAVLAESIRRLYAGTAFTVVLGIVPGKDVSGVLQALCPIAAHFVFTDPETPKGSALSELVNIARDGDVDFSVVPTIHTLGDLPPADSLIFTGSFFTALIGERLFSS